MHYLENISDETLNEFNCKLRRFMGSPRTQFYVTVLRLYASYVAVKESYLRFCYLNLSFVLW